MKSMHMTANYVVIIYEYSVLVYKQDGHFLQEIREE